jgi:hypothetical protein
MHSAGLLLGVPLALHGPAAALIGALAYSITQSIVLSATFAVSHNVPESKPLDAGQTQVGVRTGFRRVSGVLDLKQLRLVLPVAAERPACLSCSCHVEGVT